MDRNYTFPTLLCLLLTAATLNAQTDYYAVGSPAGGAGQLVQVNVTTGAESNALPILLNGSQVEGCTGMALDPTTGDVYVIAKTGSTFTLATIDVNTGVLASVATLSDKFAGIAFDNAGTLYGITGDGAATPETLYVIDTGTGAATQLAQPGAGGDGEAIAFNPLNGLLYRYGGTQVFQSIDPGNGTVVDINVVGGVPDPAAHALVHNGTSFFFAADLTLYTLSQNGSLVTLSSLPANSPGYKGLVSVDAVSVAERRREQAPTIFPNPASDRITLALEQGRMERVRVYDASGALVMDLQPGSLERTELDISGLKPGIHTVEVQVGRTARTASFSVLR